MSLTPGGESGRASLRTGIQAAETFAACVGANAQENCDSCPGAPDLESPRIEAQIRSALGRADAQHGAPIAVPFVAQHMAEERRNHRETKLRFDQVDGGIRGGARCVALPTLLGGGQSRFKIDNVHAAGV